LGNIIVKNAVVREEGFLYYIDKEGNVCKTEMIHKGRIKKKSLPKLQNKE